MSDAVEEEVRKRIFDFIRKSSQKSFLEPLKIDVDYIKKLSNINITFSLNMSCRHSFSDFEKNYLNQEFIDELLKEARNSFVNGFFGIAEQLGLKNSVIKPSEYQKLFHNFAKFLMASGVYVDMKELERIASDANL